MRAVSTSHNAPLFGTISNGSSSANTIMGTLPWLLVVALSTFLILQLTNKPALLTDESIALESSQQLPGSDSEIFVSYSYFEKDDIQVSFSVGLPTVAAGWGSGEKSLRTGHRIHCIVRQ
jgi:hypothetical protein